MYGFEAITAANGWSMVVVGIMIIFAGLTFLAFVISQLHKLLILFDKRAIYFERLKGLWKKEKKREVFKKEEHVVHQETDMPAVLPLQDINRVANYVRPLIAQLKEPFQLAQVINLSKKNNVPHPHLTISYLRHAKVIKHIGGGFFVWNQQVNEKKQD